MEDWRLQETFKAMMSIPVEGLKIVCWINGGAAISVLTFAGNLISKGVDVPVPSLGPAILWYCAGLSAGAIAFAISYLVQLTIWTSLLNPPRSPGTILRPPSLVGLGGALGVFGVVSFLLGSWNAASILAAH